MSITLTPADAEFVRDLVYRRAAIQIDASKQYLLQMRLEQLARDGGFESIRQLIARAKSGVASVNTQIVEAITTHETYFFRDVTPFDTLSEIVFPELIAARGPTEPITIWSAACSTGQESYSIAMLILERFPEFAWRPVRIVATDLSEKVLKRAREGQFLQSEVDRGLSAGRLISYFERAGTGWQVKSAVRSLVEFRQLNLLDPWGGMRPDVVFMRNVLIYFDVPSKKAILNRLRQTIAPDGALFLGSAETTLGVDEDWEQVSSGKSTFYRVRR